MKILDKELLKDIGISFLIITAIVLILMIVFYNKISIARLIPSVEEYSLSEEIQNELAQDDIDEEAEIIKTYQLEASELKQYEKTKEYNKGKKNPFAVDSTDYENNNSNNNNLDKENTDKSSSNNFYEDDGTK